ncbi:hypothetical protein F9X91_23275 [Salmonella enterica subsp. enterica serovar Infantis]|nr:hypothetical protein [Salmonella enterica subsp. enterica serovar Infantis]
MDAPPVALVSLLTTDRRLIYRPVQHLTSCQSGTWKSGNSTWRVGATFQVWPGKTQTLGRFKLCVITYRIDGKELAITQVVPTDAPDSDGNMNWSAYNGTQYSPYYMGIHCFI